MNNSGDQERINFLLTRDTAEEVIYFAKQCVRVYKGATLANKRKYGRHNTFRVAYIRSYLFHKQYILENS